MSDIKTVEQTEKEQQAIEKFQKDFFAKNKLTFSLTLDDYHAIIGVAAKATIEQGFYTVRNFLDQGDPQKNKLIAEYNKAVKAMKAPKAEKPKVRVKAGSTKLVKTA